MRINTLAKSLVCIVMAVVFQLAASAHTGLRATTPGNGAVVKVAPTEINLMFSGDVKLIKLELMGVGHEMATSFEPNSTAQASFTFATPGMHTGNFTVKWAAIGADGHTLTDSFEFEVDPTSAASVSP
ncbi:MAG: methionine-rich copper-binding protein CopC [Pseudohongiellaceae bacterium]|jgi:methionine-rich copper-binding protein CopC